MPNPLQSSPPEMLPLRLLDFDPENPRLREANVPEDATQTQIGIALWQELDAEEIVMSILAAGGFFPHEPLMVEANDGRYTVIEGNRRLLAVRVIADVKFRKLVGAEKFEGLDEVAESFRDTLKEIPCIISTRKKLWQFVGFKHVNGPKPWGAISKAEFIARVHEKQDIELNDLARQIGDRHDTVKRLYQGWCVLRQAEKSGVFKRENRKSKRFAFSHLYTILEFSNTRRFLGLPVDAQYDNKAPIRKEFLNKLGELCIWLFGENEQGAGVDPLVKSQNPDLRELDTALSKESGVKALQAGLSLQIARDASLGNKKLFDDALVKAVAALKDASAVCAVGAEGSKDEMERAEEAFNLADGIVGVVERKAKGEKKSTRGSRNA